MASDWTSSHRSTAILRIRGGRIGRKTQVLERNQVVELLFKRNFRITGTDGIDLFKVLGQ